MVLPSPPPHDASRPAETAWLDPLKLALGLSRSGLLLLVDEARPALLGELVRGLLPEHPGLEVQTEVHRVLDAPHGSTLVLVPRVEDADWLNLNRPIFAQRELKIVLFCDRDVTIALARSAVDFFDWISHRVECPDRPPSFAVAGLRCALSVRAPGISWRGDELEASLSKARPRVRLHHVSAATPYAALSTNIQQHRREWIICHDVNSHFRLRCVRWALAEARCRTRVILANPAVKSPGWWPIHARVENLREARTRLEKAGARLPGRLAALAELEPEMIQWVSVLLEEGRKEALIESALIQTGFPSLEMEDVRKQADPRRGALIVQGAAPPPLMRASMPDFRQLLEREVASLGDRLRNKELMTPEESGTWAAWAKAPGPDLSSLHVEHTAEFLLRTGELNQARWDGAAHKAILLERLK